LILNKNLYKGALNKLFIAINPRKKKRYDEEDDAAVHQLLLWFT